MIRRDAERPRSQRINGYTRRVVRDNTDDQWTRVGCPRMTRVRKTCREIERKGDLLRATHDGDGLLCEQGGLAACEGVASVRVNRLCPGQLPRFELRGDRDSRARRRGS